MRLIGHTAAATRRWLPALRRHWLVAALLGAGLALRVAAQAAYRPALIYLDSHRYLYHSGGADPVGYRAVLKPILLIGNLDLVAAVQHVLGLGMALTLYLVLTRRGAPRWLSALATAPILLDAYQVQIEQTIMPDTVFEALIVAGLAALLWRPRPPTWAIAAAGLALGASATIRQVGEAFILPGLLYLLVTLPRWRHLASRAALYTAAFALPILAYCTAAAAVTGHFRLSYTGTSELYGRLAAAADCATLTLPGYERPLCPAPADQKRLGPDGLDHSPSSPMRRYQARYQTAGPRSFSQIVSDYNGRVLSQQPARVLAALGTDAVKLFAVRRVTSPGDTPISRWQFQTTFPQYPPYVTAGRDSIRFAALTPDGIGSLGTSAQFGGGPPVVVHPLARFLRAYQLDGGYTPGPLLLLCVLAGLAGSLSLLRRRLTPAQRDTARACLLTFTAAAAVLLASDVFEFSWRYQLPALITLPPAAALGLTALTLGSRRLTPAPRERGEAAGGPVSGHFPADREGGQHPDPGEQSEGHRPLPSAAADQRAGIIGARPRERRVPPGRR